MSLETGLENFVSNPGTDLVANEQQQSGGVDSGIVVNIAEEDKAWQDYANCLGVDPDLFYPERGASTREAKEVCRGCAVSYECLEYALLNGEKFGIWGGTSERERRRIRRQRALARAAAAGIDFARSEVKEYRDSNNESDLQ